MRNDPGSTYNRAVRRQFDRLDKAHKNQGVINDVVTFVNAVQDNRLTDLEGRNVTFFNSFSIALTAGVTRFFNDDVTDTYDPRTTLSTVAGPPVSTRFTAPLLEA